MNIRATIINVEEDEYSELREGSDVTIPSFLTRTQTPYSIAIVVRNGRLKEVPIECLHIHQ